MIIPYLYVFVSSHRVLKELMTEFNTASDELINAMSRIADKNGDVNLSPLMHKTTLDVIGKVSLEKKCFKQNQNIFNFQ